MPPADIFDDDNDEEGWQDMPVVREDEFASGLDAEDQKKFHYVPQSKRTTLQASGLGNATGNLIDVDDRGNEWRSKLEQNESEYTRLRANEDDEGDEVHLRTRYLFDEDKAMTPLSQMQATKDMLTEAQRIAYVGLCALTSQEMAHNLKVAQRKELKPAVQSMELWALRIMGRLYYHMELETQEQKMIESLAVHGVQAMDLVPALITTHTVANPEYDPVEARRQADEREQREADQLNQDISQNPEESDVLEPPALTAPSTPHACASPEIRTTPKILQEPSQAVMPGVTTSLSAADKNVTLDIRWTVLCDLFLIIIADSVYDARSRVLLENVALKLGLGWLDVVRFERRVTEALEIQEGVDKTEHQELIEGRRKAARKKRYMMMGLATLGGGLVIGLSAGLLAPVIGAGLGAAFTTIGITGTTGFLAGAGGAAVITTGGVLTGSGIAGRGMARRTQQVKIFDVLPLHNNKRVSCIVTVPGFMTSLQDDVRLPFSVLDPIVGDVFSVVWEPDMIRETGSALKILTSEVLTQIGQTVLQATVMTALMSALQWPIILTKLGYLIDNPWNNALDRAKAAGSVLADVLIQRHLGVRPISLIGFSLGARVIFYALLELAAQKAYGIVQDVFLLGATLTASTKSWCEARSVVSGRFVNGYARNDWVLNYLFRATSGGLSTVAGLRPIENVSGLENVDVTDKISGHMSYRAFMPLILDQLGFPVSADYFDEPEEPDFEEERIVVRNGEDAPKKRGWFSKKKTTPIPQPVSGPPTPAPSGVQIKSPRPSIDTEDGLPPRERKDSAPTSPSASATGNIEAGESASDLPSRAGFDFDAIKKVLGSDKNAPEELGMPTLPTAYPSRSVSAPGVAAPNSRPTLPSSLGSPSLEAHAMIGPGTRPSFVRSASFNGNREEESNEEPPLIHQSTSPYSLMQVRSASTLTLSFGGSDGSPWSNHVHHDLPSINHAPESRQAETMSFGRSMSRFGTSPTTNTPAPSLDDSFAVFTSAPTLSFGAPDGSITSVNPVSARDPWEAREIMADSGKADSLNLNPWQS